MPPKEKYDPRKAAKKGTKKYKHFDFKQATKKTGKEFIGNNYILVPQSYGIVFTNAEIFQHGQGKVGTAGLAPCVGLAVMTTDTNSGIVAHFDSTNNQGEHNATDLLRFILDEYVTNMVEIVEGNHYRAWVVKGMQDAEGLYERIVAVINEFGIHVIPCTAPNGAFVIDVNTNEYNTQAQTTKNPQQLFTGCQNACTGIFKLRFPFQDAPYWTTH